MQRVRFLGAAAQVILMIIAASYFRVQVARGEHYRELADNNRLRRLHIEAPRGLIRDRLGRPLVENTPSYDLSIDRSRVKDLDATLAFAARVLGKEPEELEEILHDARRSSRFKPVRLAGGLTLEQTARLQVEALEHPGLEIEVGQRRLYRHRYQTAHILGYLGEVEESQLEADDSTYRPGDLVGKKGLEKGYESLLRGDRGEQLVVVDSRGRRVEEIDRSPADAGQDLYLTLDLELQQEAWSMLEGRVGSIVALDPRQGDLLAMVSSPSFDPNMFARRLRSEEWQTLIQNPDRPLQNRAIQNVYPPGSIFKMVMALAALDRGLVDPETTKFWCPGHSLIYNNVYRCWKAGGHGTVDLRRSLEGSCNVYYHRIGQELEIDRIAETAKRFGLGSQTGIDLEGEKGGLVPSQAWSQQSRRTPWYPGETISVATGQGPILVTPLQVAVMTAALANGGYLVTPRLHRDTEPTPPKHLGFSAEDLEVVREGMLQVVHGTQGTGFRAKVTDLEIAGKTGTAQVITQERRTDNEDLPEKLRDHAWFTSFAPYEDPRLVVVIFIEHGGAGSSIASPLARALYERFLETDLASHRSAG